MTTRAQIAAALKEAANSYFRYIGFSCFNELGLVAWGRRRADMIGVRLSGELVLVEVKSSVADWKADKKYLDYLPFCNKFYWCMTEDVFKKLEPMLVALNKEHGLGALLLSPRTGRLYAKLKAVRRSVSGKNRKAIVIRMAWRAGSNKGKERRKRIFIGGNPC